MAGQAVNKRQKQPLKLSSSLSKITKLCLGDEKTSLVSNSVLSGLAIIKNGKESSATLIQVLGTYYSHDSNSFEFNTSSSLRFCSKEVAHVLGVEDVGNDIDIEQLPHRSFPTFVTELRDLYCEGRSRGSKSAVLTAAELKKILIMMGVEDDASKMKFRKLFLYYLIDQFLLASTNKNPRSKCWQMVENMDLFEAINWPKTNLMCIYQSLAKLKSDNSGISEGASHSNQFLFGSCTPVLEAMVYARIPSLRPEVFSEDPPIIQKYVSSRKALNDWDLGNLTPSKIQSCPYCGEETDLEAASADVHEGHQSIDEAMKLVEAMELVRLGSQEDEDLVENDESDDVGGTQNAESDDVIGSQIVGSQEDEGLVENDESDDVGGVQNAESDNVRGSQIPGVRHSTRQIIPPPRLIDEMSGKKGKRRI